MADRLETIYNSLEPRQGDKILLSSADSMLIGAYLAGRARDEKMDVSVRCLITPGSAVDSEAKISEAARRDFPDKLDTIQSGFPRISFRICNLLDENVSPDFNKFFCSGDLNVEQLAAMDTHASQKLALLEMPVSYAMLLETGEGGFMRRKPHQLSLKQFLGRIGMDVREYDVWGSRLWCLVSWTGLDRKHMVRFKNASTEAFATVVRREIFEKIRLTRPGSRFALQSGDGEYLYIIETLASSEAGEGLVMKFVFMHDTWVYEAEGKKQFSIIIVPDTPTFRRELDSKEIFVLPPSKLYEVFGERVEF